MKYNEQQVKALVWGIYEGRYTPYHLPQDLYLAIAEYLKDALYKGFGATLSTALQGSRDLELLVELRENVYMFSAAKTYQQLREISALLVDADGLVRPYREFREEFYDVFGRYNESYLKTEHTTAIGQAQCAVNWNRIQEKKTFLPYLRYSAVGGEQVCEVCGRLHGTTLPVDHPFWKRFYPINHFNCMCTVEQLSRYDAVAITPDAEVSSMSEEMAGKIEPLFLSNAGITGALFDSRHPYFEVPQKDKAYARRNFDLPIPKRDEQHGNWDD